MNYALLGHDRDNAVQEMLISLLPDEPHDRQETLTGDGCLSRAWEEGGQICAECTVTLCAQRETARVSAPIPGGGDGEEHKRVLTYCVKSAVYRALLPLLDHKPAWGSLTGVKPAKPVRLAIREGMDRQALDRWLDEHYDVTPRRRGLCIRAAEYALRAEDSLLPGEVQLYIGIPFCPAKCSYCSFVSNDTARWGHMIEPYVQALLQEVEAAGTMLRRGGIPLGSIYIGGGTPTTLNEDQLERLLTAVDAHFDRSACREYTVEAGRPETTTAEKLRIMARHGVSRISINPQTMNDRVLQGVGRRHTAADIVECYRTARECGDFIVNMDLIAGLPGDDDGGLLDSVRRVADLEPENITIHCLARKRGARLYFGPTGQLPAETLDGCYDLLAARGYEPYYLYRQKYMAGNLENVGYCKPGTASIYNVDIMEEIMPIAAFGAGAISKWLYPAARRIERAPNVKNIEQYIARVDEMAERKRALWNEEGK